MGRVFRELIVQTSLSKGVSDYASVIVEGFPDSTEGFAFCLSEDGDLLSQWRAYGKDGTGFSIGFDSSMLQKDFGDVNFGRKFFELKQVAYGEEELRRRLGVYIKHLLDEFGPYGEFVSLSTGITIEEALRRLADRAQQPTDLFQLASVAAEPPAERLLHLLGDLHFTIFDTKPVSFHEEKEWRLIRYRHREALPELEYWADDNGIRPYISSLIADPAVNSIQELVLGPKNKSNIGWLRAFMISQGMGHVRIRASSITSYR